VKSRSSGNIKYVSNLYTMLAVNILKHIRCHMC